MPLCDNGNGSGGDGNYFYAYGCAFRIAKQTNNLINHNMEMTLLFKMYAGDDTYVESIFQVFIKCAIQK